MKTLTEVLATFTPEVRGRYDFSAAVYGGALSPITGIACSEHGPFQQYAAQLRKGGAGCPACGKEKRAKSRRMSPEEFISRAQAVHPGRFVYTNTEYTNMTTKVVVTCPAHGDFTISPIKLVHGAQGCPACGGVLRGVRRDIAGGSSRAADTKRATFRGKFEARARAVHGDLYDYSQHEYTSGRGKVRIQCPVHGEFNQAVYHHLSGQGCPRCGQKSAPEDAVAAYLSQFAVVERRNRSLIAPKEVDIYLPGHKLAVEFCGMYWHSHGDKGDERKNKLRHAEKYALCAAQGVRLITIYETEWSERPATIKRLLRNAVRATRGRLMARKCVLQKPAAPEARAFYEKYHPQGGTGTGEHYGLYWRGELVACMRFSFGNNDRGAGAANRIWTLGRYATRISVAGAASRLFTAFLREHSPDEVKSFSDNRLFEGSMYTQLGFTLDADVPPDYQVWSKKLGLRPKPHYQRRLLPLRLRDHGVIDAFDPGTDTRTEAEMTYHMGARRIYDCGKKRWVWRRPSE